MEVKFSPEFVQSFWARIRVAGNNDCWEWTRARLPGKRPYGVVATPSRNWRTHRLAWTLARGAIPAGMCVCHRCDNPPCCNPSHLFLGTLADNVADMVKKSRQHRKYPVGQAPERGRRSGRRVIVINNAAYARRMMKVMSESERQRYSRLVSRVTICRVVGTRGNNVLLMARGSRIDRPLLVPASAVRTVK
jgi:hypothetical protein